MIIDNDQTLNQILKEKMISNQELQRFSDIAE
jgi:hypothetical protein